MNISGVSGYSVLKYPDIEKEVLIFSDIHDGVEYCLDGVFIDEIFKNVHNDIIILLEEVPRLGVELIELFPDAEHTRRLRDLYVSNKYNIIGVDLRPYLIPFSHMKINFEKLSKNESNMSMLEYLNLLEVFFNPEKKRKVKYPLFLENVLNLLKELESRSGIGRYYNELRDKYNDIKNGFNMEGMFIDNKDKIEVLNKLDDLLVEIMDWYILLIIKSKRDDIIIHVGLYHYVNIVSRLKEMGFKELKSDGIRSLKYLENKSCVRI